LLKLIGANSENFVRIKKFIKAKRQIRTLEERFYLNQISVCFCKLLEQKDVMEPVNQVDIIWENIKELYMLIQLMDKAVMSSDFIHNAISFAAACQNPDGGFGFYHGSTSFMENTYYGVSVFELFGQPVPNPELVLGFIMSSRAKDGGFGRKNRTAPFLDSTYFAVEPLLAMDRINGGSLLREQGYTP
jgi:prenyltransferase beta subunit